MLEQGLHFSIYGGNNNVIYNKEINPLDVLTIKDIPSVLKNAILASTFILNDCDSSCSPSVPVDKRLSKKCNFVYTDVLTKEYILNSIIKSNLDRGDNSPDLYYKFRYYLATNWLAKNFTIDNFISFLLNYSYYGKGILGIKEAARSFLGKDLTKDHISPEEAAFLVDKLFNNTSCIYQYTNIKDKISKINVKSILSSMVQLGYIDKLDEQKIINLSEEVLESTNIYQVFNEKIFNIAMPLTTTTNNIYIYTTLYKNLQEALNEKLLEVAKNYNLANVAVYGVGNGQIFTGLNISMKNGKAFYNNEMPNIKTKDLLKPLLYTGLFSNNINVPTALMNSNIQNVINVQKFDPKGLVKIFPSFSMKNNIGVDYIEQTNNEKDSLYYLVSQLVAAENELFNKLDSTYIMNLNHIFNLPEKSLVKLGDQITLTTTLDNIVNSFAILNQEGKYYTPIYINKINNQPFDSSKEIVNSNLNITNINKAMNLINYETYNNNKYKVVYDTNMAVIYYNNYTIGIYISNPPSDENKYYILKEIANYIVQFLTQNIMV